MIDASEVENPQEEKPPDNVGGIRAFLKLYGTKRKSYVKAISNYITNSLREPPPQKISSMLVDCLVWELVNGPSMSRMVALKMLCELTGFTPSNRALDWSGRRLHSVQDERGVIQRIEIVNVPSHSDSLPDGTAAAAG